MSRQSLGRTAADTKVLYIRCSSRQVREIRKVAERAGFHSVAEWLRVVISGELGRQKILLAKAKAKAAP